MASLLNWLGKKADDLIPGDQSNWHPQIPNAPQRPQAPIQRPAAPNVLAAPAQQFVRRINSIDGRPLQNLVNGVSNTHLQGLEQLLGRKDITVGKVAQHTPVLSQALDFGKKTQQRKDNLGNFVTGIGGAGVEGASYVAPELRILKGAKGANLATRAGIKAVNMSAAPTALSVANDLAHGKRNPGEIAGNAAMTAGVNAAIPLVGKGLKLAGKGIKGAAQNIKAADAKLGQAGHIDFNAPLTNKPAPGVQPDLKTPQGISDHINFIQNQLDSIPARIKETQLRIETATNIPPTRKQVLLQQMTQEANAEANALKQEHQALTQSLQAMGRNHIPEAVIPPNLPTETVIPKGAAYAGPNSYIVNPTLQQKVAGFAKQVAEPFTRPATPGMSPLGWLRDEGGYIGQPRDLVGKFSKGKQDDLTLEARKYKSAQEFIDSQLKLHHGTPYNFDDFKKQTTYFTPDEKFARRYSDAKSIDQKIHQDTKIMSVYHSGDGLFDYKKPQDIDRLAQALPDKTYSIRSEQFGSVFSAPMTKAEVIKAIKSGDWTSLENPEINKVVKKLGYEGHIAEENGAKTVAIYDPTTLNANERFSRVEKKAEELANIWKQAQLSGNPEQLSKVQKMHNANSSAPTKGKQEAADYRGGHQITDGTPIHKADIAGAINQIKGKYGLSRTDQLGVAKLQKLANNPEADVKIYRASPKNELNGGDWVTTDKSYANSIKQQNGGTVHEYTIKAKELQLPGNIEDNPSLARFSAFKYAPTKGKQADPLDTLKAEALKHDKPFDFAHSALKNPPEGFTKGYHATPEANSKAIREGGFKASTGVNSQGLSKGKGVWMYPDYDHAEAFAKGSKSMADGKYDVIPSLIKGKLMDLGDDFKNIAGHASNSDLIAKAKAEGYVGLRGKEPLHTVDANGKSKTIYRDTMFVFDGKDIATHKQLENLYNQAHATKKKSPLDYLKSESDTSTPKNFLGANSAGDNLTEKDLNDILATQQKRFGDNKVDFGKPTTANAKAEYNPATDQITLRKGGADMQTYNHETVHKAIAQHLTGNEVKQLYSDVVKLRGGKKAIADFYRKEGYTGDWRQAAEEEIANHFNRFLEDGSVQLERNGLAGLARWATMNGYPQTLVKIFMKLAAVVDKHFGRNAAAERLGNFYKHLDNGTFATKQPNIASPFQAPKFALDSKKALGAPLGKGDKPTTSKLPTVHTQKVSTMDKMWRSTRSIIERQGEHGKQLGGMLQKSRDIEELYQAKLIKQLPTVMKLKGKDFETFVEATQGKLHSNDPKINQAVKEWQSTHPSIRDRAVGAGLDVGDLGKTYYPHFIDYDKIFKDTNTYNKAINHLVETGQAKTQEEAIKLLNYAKDVSRNRAFGNLEASRTIDLPFYDKTPNSLRSYLQSASKRIAQTETFGAKDENALKLITKAGSQGFDTEAMKNAYDVAVGAKKYNPSTEAASRNVRRYITTTRLGLGALTNVSQNVNTGIVTGHMRTLGAALKQLDPKTREFVGDTGVISDAILNDIRQAKGDTFGSTALEKGISKITAPGFGAVEKFNRSVASTAGRDYALRLAQKGDEKTLRKLGVTGEIANKTLTKDQQIQAARKIVEKTQFKVDPQDLPGWVDSPGGKLVAQFRTFSYAQGKFFSNEIIKPAAKGNLLPLARLMAAMPVGYALYEARRVIDGRPEEDNQGRKALEAFSKLGGAGLAVDLFRGMVPLNGKYVPTDRRVAMAIGTIGGPAVGVASQAIGGVSEAIQRKKVPDKKDGLEGKVVVGNDGEKYTDLTSLSRFGLSQIPIVGTPIKNRLLPYSTEAKASGVATTDKQKAMEESIAKSEAAVKAAEANGTRPKDGQQKKISTGSKIQDASNKRIEDTKAKLPQGISETSTKTLLHYAKLNENGKAVFNKDPKNKYQLHAAQLEENQLSGKLSGPKLFAAKEALGKEAITSKYSQEVLDFYGMSKAQQRAYFAQDTAKAKALYAKAQELDNELNGKQFIATSKYKYGLASGKGGRKTGAGSRGGKPKLPTMPKIAALKTPSFKVSTPKIAKVSAYKSSFKLPKAVSKTPKPIRIAKAKAPKKLPKQPNRYAV